MSSEVPRQISMVAFMQAQNCSNYVGSWRHPATMNDFMEPEYYQRIARTLEDGLFDMAFFDDRLAMPDIYGADHRETVAHGIRAVKLDPTPVLMAMAAVTRKLGLGATCSTTYYEPFHVARLFATLDLMTKGRVAWNVVTSLNDSEAENFGRDAHEEHDLRYDRADEFLEVVMGHWDSWEDGALILDKQGDRFADPQKVHRLDHAGRFYKSRGPFTVPRSRQGNPVILQAGQSGRGMAFAARWAELVFAAYPNLEIGKKQYAHLKGAAEAAGRDPASVKIAPAVKVFVAESEALAREKYEYAGSMGKPIDALALLCEVLNVDFSSRPYEQPFSDEELAAVSWHSLRDQVIRVSGKKNPSVRDFVECSGRGTIKEGPAFIGTPTQVADQMQEWFESCCDGFVLQATSMPGTYEEFVRLVVPELQRRGLYRKAYPGETLRDTLGLERPAARDWRRYS
ncbi:LLM class flavin-dependent oxidoreductase [Pseudomonas sp. CAN2814]|uniref:LLM class flavin-dependent oxidoreductase n=1 Tax=Pseudomonas sp. CAN1 TaxID=3046726 RepID=UPI00264A2929|nr:LLM class flavin-dependent oxidoreductase [Pseudomonas sp. CAN1]MDN6860232.1 LLM class flavin-dependent oxidoreductase [Pseudomonas sp. CAN1]